MPLRRSIPSSRPIGTALLAAAFALCAGPSSGAPARRAPPAPTPRAAPSIDDFARLAGARALACQAPADPRLAALGRPERRQCAWNGRLELLVWRALPGGAGDCLPPAAVAWQRLASTADGAAAPWNTAWSSQSRIKDGEEGHDGANAAPGATREAVAVWRGADGAWSAALWRWQPADKPATRAWQAGHWNDVVRTARTLGAPPAPAPAASAALLQAWADATRGRARVVDGERRRWIAERTCLSLQAAPVAQSQVHLPFARDDARLEQRTAMQVQLARRYPDADWLQPFTLLDPAAGGARPDSHAGAKFSAVWREGATVTGQLWIPLRVDGGVARARVTSVLPGANASADAGRARAALVERELAALAGAWEARYE